MTKYQELISKIQTIKNFQNLKENPDPNYNFNSAELELILNVLETMQFLEIFFKDRRIKQQNHEI